MKFSDLYESALELHITKSWLNAVTQGNTKKPLHYWRSAMKGDPKVHIKALVLALDEAFGDGIPTGEIRKELFRASAEANKVKECL